MSEGRDSPFGDNLWEVAVALPMAGTYTYRDPRPGSRLPIGTQVVVPFGGRTVTGFVLGPGTALADPAAVKDIESIVGSEPAFDPDVLGLCRWAADYYQAPLGQLLRAGLPQGERARSIRQVRLTPQGERAARGEGAQPAQIVLGGVDMKRSPGAERAAGPEDLMRWLLEAGGELATSSIARRLDAVDRRRGHARASQLLARLEEQGLVEVGDEVSDRRAPPTIAFAVAVLESTSGGPPPASAPARRTLWEKVRGAAEGIPTSTLKDSEKALLRALVNAGLVRIERRPVRASPSGPPSEAGAGPTLNEGQAAAMTAIAEALGQGYATFLLQGVTGSGKTEVYLRVIAQARAAGRGALVLVPEIALTPQLAGRFRARFGDDVAVLHSALAPRERLAAWRRLRAGEVGIALGARSAVFAPVRDLGIVVVDEEHDPSFKQEEGVRYHGRDLAVVRAQRAGAVAVLGSATPSLESRHNAHLGRFRRLLLPVRATPRPLPPVEIIDLRRHRPDADGLFSWPLAEAVAANLAAGQQTILFLNRRGFSTFVMCGECGNAIQCPDCAVSMTYHRGRDRLVCHYCGKLQAVPALCPSCQRPKLERLGMGTERVETLVRERFPGARVARLDRDTAGARANAPEGGHLNAILRAMNAGEIDILIGTQMVTKGHDFGGVTLVGVLQPDLAMHIPDFRASERVFQLLEQVAGRAGRGDRPGRVLVQTRSPDHVAIAAVLNHDYEAFVRGELAARNEHGYPPFTRAVALRIDGTDDSKVREAAAVAARAAATAGGDRVRLVGPGPAPIERLRGRTRFQVWLYAKERAPLAAAARAASSVKLGSDVRLVVDVDPQSTL